MFYYSEENRDYVGNHGEMVGEVIAYVVYRDGVEMATYEHEEDAAEACDYGNDVQRQAEEMTQQSLAQLASLRKEG